MWIRGKLLIQVLRTRKLSFLHFCFVFYLLRQTQEARDALNEDIFLNCYIHCCQVYYLREKQSIGFFFLKNKERKERRERKEKGSFDRSMGGNLYKSKEAFWQKVHLVITINIFRESYLASI